jgi:hypothetical protein
MLVGDDRISSEHVWCEILTDAHRGGPALYLDRDRVVVEETGYLYRVEDIRLILDTISVQPAAQQAAEAIAEAIERTPLKPSKSVIQRSPDWACAAQ